MSAGARFTVFDPGWGGGADGVGVQEGMKGGGGGRAQSFGLKAARTCTHGEMSVHGCGLCSRECREMMCKHRNGGKNKDVCLDGAGLKKAQKKK